MIVYIVLKHDYYLDKDVIVFATADQNYAQDYCKEKNSKKKWGCYHFRVKRTKLKEVVE